MITEDEEERMKSSRQKLPLSVCTFVPGRLGPQNAGDVARPGVFDVCGGGLEDEGLILSRPPSEPDLKAQPVVSRRLRQTHICCLDHKHHFNVSQSDSD